MSQIFLVALCFVVCSAKNIDVRWKSDLKLSPCKLEVEEELSITYISGTFSSHTRYFDSGNVELLSIKATNATIVNELTTTSNVVKFIQWVFQPITAPAHAVFTLKYRIEERYLNKDTLSLDWEAVGDNWPKIEELDVSVKLPSGCRGIFFTPSGTTKNSKVTFDSRVVSPYFGQKYTVLCTVDDEDDGECNDDLEFYNPSTDDVSAVPMFAAIFSTLCYCLCYVAPLSACVFCARCSKRNRVASSHPPNSIELQQRRVMVLQNPLVVSPASFVYRTQPQNPIPPPMQTTLPVRQNIFTPTPPPPPPVHENTPPTKPTIAEPPPQNELKLEDAENGTQGDCKICFDKKVDVILIGIPPKDCGHAAVCQYCAKLLKECPICRAPIDRVIKIYAV